MWSSRYSAGVNRWKAVIARLLHDFRAWVPCKSEGPLVRGLGCAERMSAIFTMVDFSTEAVGSIWRITTGLSVGLSTIMLIVAAFCSMFAQSNKYLMQAFPGIVLAILGPQVAAGKVRYFILSSPFFFVSARCWLKSRCDTGSFLGVGGGSAVAGIGGRALSSCDCAL